MTTQALFWLTVGPSIAAVVLSLLADAFAATKSPAAAAAGALMLGGGAVAALVGGATVPGQDAVTGFRVGGAMSTAAGVVLALTACALAASIPEEGVGRRGLAPLAALAATGAVLATLSDDLLITVLALETVSVTAYALVAYAKTRPASESAMKYFVQGSVATGFLLVGLVVLSVVVRGDSPYGALAGSAELLGITLPISMGVVLVCGALAFKAGAAPFHAWVPDAYGSSDPLAAAVLAGPVKLSAAAALSVFVTRAVPLSGDVFSPGSVLGDVLPVLALIALTSMIVGSFGALGQRSYARMLGYAGIAQVGYAVVAVASLNASAAAVHLVLYSVAATGAFTAAAAWRRIDSTWDGSVQGLAGLGARRPALAAAMTVCMVSLAGIPALAGFWGKFQVFGAGVAASFALWGAGSWWQGPMYASLVVVGVVSSVVSVAYYGGVVRSVYAPGPQVDSAADAAPVSRPDADVDSVHGSEPGAARRVVAVPVALAVVLVACGAAPFLVGLTESMVPFIY